jgi:glycosyltransferase involved in cell wall biosynthesis
MRIAQISTLSSPVGRKAGGSVEAFVWLLTAELIRLGHEVTVFACAGSETDGELMATLPGPYGANGAFDDWQLCEWVNLCRAVEHSDRFDVLHSHAYLWAIPLQALSRSPLVHTLHIVPDENAARLWSMAPGSHVTAISRYQWGGFPALQPTTVIPHGIDVSQFTFQAKPDDYVCYLGRFVSGKGPLHAIQAARALGVRLRMAGPPNAYFREHVQPLVDGQSVEYVGYVSGDQRNQLLGGAKALLYPIQYPEAFGLVLLEAMLCGTPVAAIDLGAVPEIVDEGITGCMALSMDEFPPVITKTFSLDRRKVRQQAEARFSAEKMARQYARVYEQAMAAGWPR